MTPEQEQAIRERVRWFQSGNKIWTSVSIEDAAALLAAFDAARAEVETVNRLAERAIDDARAERDAYRRNASLAERRRTEQAEAERDAARRDLAVAQEHLMWTGGLPDIEALVSRMKNAEAERDTVLMMAESKEQALVGRIHQLSTSADRVNALLSGLKALEHWYRTLAASADHVGAGILKTVADDISELCKDSEG